MPSADFCSITSGITTRGATTRGGRKVGQISPGKNMILPCTTAAFTISHVLQTGFVMLCSLTQGFGLICGFCSSARRFALRLLSDGRSPFRPCHRLVLFKVDSLSPSWKMYRGLAPHKIMPMPGTHNTMHPTATVAALLSRRVMAGVRFLRLWMIKKKKRDRIYLSLL